VKAMYNVIQSMDSWVWVVEENKNDNIFSYLLFDGTCWNQNIRLQGRKSVAHSLFVYGWDQIQINQVLHYSQTVCQGMRDMVRPGCRTMKTVVQPTICWWMELGSITLYCWNCYWLAVSISFMRCVVIRLGGIKTCCVTHILVVQMRLVGMKKY